MHNSYKPLCFYQLILIHLGMHVSTCIWTLQAHKDKITCRTQFAPKQDSQTGVSLCEVDDMCVSACNLHVCGWIEGLRVWGCASVFCTYLTTLDCEFHCIFVAGDVCVSECVCMCATMRIWMCLLGWFLLDLMRCGVQGQRNHIPKVWLNSGSRCKMCLFGKIVLTNHASTSSI